MTGHGSHFVAGRAPVPPWQPFCGAAYFMFSIPCSTQLVITFKPTPEECCVQKDLAYCKRACSGVQKLALCNLRWVCPSLCGIFIQSASCMTFFVISHGGFVTGNMVCELANLISRLQKQWVVPFVFQCVVWVLCGLWHIDILIFGTLFVLKNWMRGSHRTKYSPPQLFPEDTFALNPHGECDQ